MCRGPGRLGRGRGGGGGAGEGGQGQGELGEQEAAGLHLHTPRAGQGVARRGVGVSVVTCITRFIKGVREGAGAI